MQQFNYEILLRFLLAALWGGIVGAEREYRSKAAGFRTMIMISIGSCFFTIMSQILGHPGNEDRIASNIVTGIGFLGAGVISFGDNKVSGITTSATIWSVAAVGMGIGAGYYFAATCASISILIVLAVLPYLERKIDRMNQSKTYTIHCKYSPQIVHELEVVFEKHNLKFKLIKQEKDGEGYLVSWYAEGSALKHQLFASEVINDNRVNKFMY